MFSQLVTAVPQLFRVEILPVDDGTPRIVTNLGLQWLEYMDGKVDFHVCFVFRSHVLVRGENWEGLLVSEAQNRKWATFPGLESCIGNII